jgi:thioredoxin-like negative regulator of GroEL
MGSAPNLSLKEADELFRQQAYPEAAQAYEQLLQQAEISPLSLSRIQLMLGICQLQTGAPDEARRSLARAGQHREQAEWYTALSWLKEGKVEKAREALQLLQGQESHFYQQQATELLDKLPT